jgi:hypothetical protein
VSRDMKTEVTRIEEALDKILTAIEEHERSTEAERPKRPFKFAAAADVTAIDDFLDDPVGRSLRRGIKELGQRLFELGGTKYRRQLERPRLVSVFFSMSSDRVIIDAIKMAQDLLSQNLAPTRNLTDAATVMRLRELIRSQAIRSALERSSDTVLAFGLRAVEQVISDQSRTNHETINRLWDVLDDPHLNKALGLPQNSRKPFRSSGF